MRKILLFSIFLNLIYHLSFAATPVSGGNVSGTWTVTGSPYQVNGNITVATGATLTINPGVTVQFTGPYRLIVNGRLLAVGTQAQKILFTKTDTIGLYKKLTPAGGGTGRWNGISFENASADTSRLTYCTIEYCNTYENQANPYFEKSAVSCYYSKLVVSACALKNNYGFWSGAIFSDYGYLRVTNSNITSNRGFDGAGAIYCNTNQPKIFRGNTITNNKGVSGGAFMLSQCGSNVIVQDNFIANNSAGTGGGIACQMFASGQVIQNIIVNNTANYGGGVAFANAGMIFLNNIVCNNLATMGGGGLWFSSQTFFNAENNIIWGNKYNAADNNIEVYSTDAAPAFKSCLIGGGVSTISINPGNVIFPVPSSIITTSPLFVNPTPGVGIGFNSVPADWKLSINSPCLNSGTVTTFPEKMPVMDFFGKGRISYEKIDIGPHEFSQGSVSAGGTISTPTLWIADTIKITSNLTVNASLKIAPGVVIQYQGYYDITLNGPFSAEGTANNPILFTIKDTTGFANISNTNGRYKGISTSGISGQKFRYCIFRNAERLYFSSSPNLIFENNLAENCMADQNFIVVTGNNPSFRYNTFRKMFNVQGNYYKVLLVFSDNCIFEGNRMYNNKTASFESYGSYMKFFNNLIYNNDGNAILQRSGYSNIYVNNTFAYNFNGIIVEQGSARFYNNIIYKNFGYEFYSLNYVDEMLLSHNILGTPISPQSWETYDSNTIVDPKFVKPVTTMGASSLAMNADYGILSISPAIDKGITNINNFAFPSLDANSKPRINNSLVDLGAVENSYNLPVVSVQPVGGSFCESQNISMTVQPAQSDTVLFQWRKNGVNINGAVNKTLSINNITSDDIGSYTCMLSNSYGSVESYPATLNVKAKPSILYISGNQNICAGKELALEVSATGQLPLTYAWQKNTVAIGGATSSKFTIASAQTSNTGTYRSVVTNQCGSAVSSNISVTVNALPVVSLGRDTTLCAKNNYTLDPGIYRSYLWNDFTANRYRKAEASGQYSVKVTDNNGCEATSNTVNITINNPFPNQVLCMVTVDRETKKNMIIWDHTSNAGIRSYNIYKLFGNNLVPIGNVVAGELPVYVDHSSSPEAVASRYAISVTDTCGNESAISKYHQTIHLGASLGAKPNTIVLDWSPYIDESNVLSPSFYLIYRGMAQDKMVLFDSVSSAFTSWNDLNPGDNLFYQVGLRKAVPCDPARLLGKKTSSGPFIHSLSNLEDNKLRATAIEQIKAGKAVIYPNPMQEECRIRWANPAAGKYMIRLYDQHGTLVRTAENIVTDEFILKREGLPAGIYVIEVAGKDLFRGMLVIH